MTALVDRTPSVLDRSGPLHRLAVAEPAPVRRARAIDVALGAVAALIGAAVVASGIDVYPALGGDEGIYTSQAWAVLQGRVTPYTYTYDHPFAGWAQLAPLQQVAGWLHWGAGNAVVDARAVMTLYAFATLLLTYGLARRWGMRRTYSVLVVLVLGLCPLFVVDARQVYLDNLAMPWLLGAFFLALSPARRQWTFGLAGVVFAVAVLSKETVVLMLPALGYVVWTRAYRPIRSMSVVAFVVLGTSLVLGYPLFAMLRGELFPGDDHVSLWSNGIMYQLASRKGSGALWEAGSARQALVGYWASLDHLLLFGGTAAGVVCLAIRRLRAVGLVVVLWALPVVKPGGYLPAMYVIAVLPWAALALVGLLDAAHHRVAAALPHLAAVRGRAAAGVVAGVVAALVGTAFWPVLRTASWDAPDLVGPVRQAEAYVADAVPADADIVVDPAMWTDLVQQGRGQPWHGVISYYQFDLDPVMSSRELPHGWMDIDYVVVTPAMTSNIRDLSLTRLPQVIAHSTAVQAWGDGGDRIELRRVENTPYNHDSEGLR